MKTDLVVAGYIVHNSKVLLIHHRKLGIWIPPGGHIEKDETPDDALKREFKEELGLDIEILNRNDAPAGGSIKRQLAVPFYANVHGVGDHDHCCLYYICEAKDLGKLEANRSELKDFGWFSAEDLDQDDIPADTRNISKKALEIYTSLKN